MSAVVVHGMSKVEEYNYLVVYREYPDYTRKVEELRVASCVVGYVHKVTDQKLTVQTTYGTHETYYFKRFTGDVEGFWMSICGCRFSGVIYLNGEYPSLLLNYITTRCRP